MGKKIRVKCEASPWKNGSVLSRRQWLVNGSPVGMLAASVREVSLNRQIEWWAHMPGSETAIAHGWIPWGDNKTLARINAKKAADEALRAATGGKR